MSDYQDVADALAPCPFCGSGDVHNQSDYTDENQVVCAVCDARGPMRRASDAAATSWNRRAATARIAELQAKRDALEAEVRRWRECALYDATMEGPIFKGWDRSALERARAATSGGE